MCVGFATMLTVTEQLTIVVPLMLMSLREFREASVYFVGALRVSLERGTCFDA